ncbi:oxidoreductase C-terminal domain-containing protein [Saccharopolyspora sp. NPDC049426]|uniref:oxidoreductase C-terminal domain-containing protein n=1 Tax=Saccharopolyspora sp. NPDC049426 TaxID=3155652 RepID=UPI003424DB2A
MPYFWSDRYGHRIQSVGTLRSEEALIAVPTEAGSPRCTCAVTGSSAIATTAA